MLGIWVTQSLGKIDLNSLFDVVWCGRSCGSIVGIIWRLTPVLTENDQVISGSSKWIAPRSVRPNYQLLGAKRKAGGKEAEAEETKEEAKKNTSIDFRWLDGTGEADESHGLNVSS